jgi:hypothetical protein
MAMTMMAPMERGIDTDSGSALKPLCKASIAKGITALLLSAGEIVLNKTASSNSYTKRIRIRNE